MENSFKKELEEFLLLYHKDQKDKGGHPYINHLRFVSNLASKLTKGKGFSNEEILQVEVLGYCHDLLEDTAATLEDIHAFLRKNNIRIPYFYDGGFDNDLTLLTHNKEDSYFSFISKIVLNGGIFVATVKLADLINNSDLTRLKEVTTKDEERAKKYQKAITVINDKYRIINV